MRQHEEEWVTAGAVAVPAEKKQIPKGEINK